MIIKGFIGKIERQIQFKIFDMATQTMFLGVFNNFIYDNQFFTKSNYNRNKHTHENDIIKSKGEILCNVAHIKKKYYHFT